MEEQNYKLIVGLGNPGSQYQDTRHNLGFLVVEELAKILQVEFKPEKNFFGETAKAIIDEVQIFLLKPMTFMNLSGTAVEKIMQFFKMRPEEVLVVTDDAALEFGDVRLKPKGSSGGHLGLRHIESKIGDQYPRLKMGIGAPNRGTLEDYVLQKFNKQETDELPAFIDRGVDVIKLWLESGLEMAMNQANTKKK